MFNVVDGIDQIEAVADAPDTFGDRDITGTADITTVFRNLFQNGAIHASGFLNRSPQGVFSFEDIGRATLLGITRADFTAGTLQNAFRDPAQQLTQNVLFDNRDVEYRINGLQFVTASSTGFQMDYSDFIY